MRIIVLAVVAAIGIGVMQVPSEDAMDADGDGFSLAKRIGEGGTLINMLVGIAIEAIRQGAFHYWAKGQPADAIRPLVASAMPSVAVSVSTG
mgnify:CR=1 FL=1